MHIRDGDTTDGDELIAGVGVRVGTLILELCALAVFVFCLSMSRCMTTGGNLIIMLKFPISTQSSKYQIMEKPFSPIIS